MTKKELATAILSAQELQEESWDRREYNITTTDAAAAVSNDRDVIVLVSMLNHVLWNDIQDWAKRVLGKEGE